jgi:hypothetical protein
VRLGETARAGAEPWAATPDDFARRLRDLVERVAAVH